LHFFLNSFYEILVIENEQWILCGWVKLNVLQKRWFVCRLAALLILRGVGILSFIVCSFVVGRVVLLG